MAAWVGVALLLSTGLCIGLRKLPVYAAFALLPPAAALLLGFSPLECLSLAQSGLEQTMGNAALLLCSITFLLPCVRRESFPIAWACWAAVSAAACSRPFSPQFWPPAPLWQAAQLP